jgi:hypothetical protein
MADITISPVVQQDEDRRVAAAAAEKAAREAARSALPAAPAEVGYDGSSVGPQKIGSGSNGPVNGYGNSLDMADQMNAQAAKMKELYASPALPTPGGSSIPEAPKYNPFDRPGDGNGDAAGRASRYDNLMQSAASQTGFGAKRRSAAMLGAAQGMLAPGLAQMEAQGKDYAQQMGALNNGSLPVNIGGSGGLNADTMKGLMSMFQTNQKPGDPPAPGATTPVTATTTPVTTPAVTSPTATTAPTQASAFSGYNSPLWDNVNDATKLSSIGRTV